MMNKEPRCIFFCKFIMVLSALGTLMAPVSTWGAKCGYDSAHYHIMPREIGRRNEVFKTPYKLPCDSMVVPKGDTSIIYESSMLHFGINPSTSSKITVLGTMIVLGTSEHPVYFSGSMKQTQLGYFPGESKWSGIDVDSSATIKFENARIFNCPTAMTILSRNTVMRNSYFQGSVGIILPDTSIALNFDGTSVDTLDLRKPIRVVNQKKSAKNGIEAPPHLGSGGNSGKVSGKKVALYSLAGMALVTAVSGGTYYFLKGDVDNPTNPPTPTGMDTKPSVPSNPKSR